MKKILYRSWFILSRFMLLVLCVTCSRWNFVQVHNNTSNEFTPYIQEFTELTNKPVDIHVNFEILYGEVAGLCYYRLIGNEISIDRSKWKNYTKDQRRFLIFHELSHCVCNTGHTDDELPNQLCADNYMHPYLQADHCVKVKEKEYIEQLKKDCR